MMRRPSASFPDAGWEQVKDLLGENIPGTFIRDRWRPYEKLVKATSGGTSSRWSRARARPGRDGPPCADPVDEAHPG